MAIVSTLPSFVLQSCCFIHTAFCLQCLSANPRAVSHGCRRYTTCPQAHIIIYTAAWRMTMKAGGPSTAVAQPCHP
ncbi:hypothetical protein EV702DRAFT_607685 [Suillus placidus]|uniref:Secreted protein n=1 Tax=Suillus placidus TaxID=48579 RepID=A0A9P7D718_9AGAM|nr:hypothetical protein EV702DRAFT_607685 [Suillus placidus]